jgi:hypothetical protein
LITYLMLDDDAGSEAPAEGYAEAFVAAAGGELTIKVERPGSMADTIAMITAEAPGGLLLDVALTNAQDQEGQPVGFDGIALAQQVRTLQTRARTAVGAGGLPEFPVIRLSKRDVIREYVNQDSTSDDLFDEFVEKEALIDEAEISTSIILSLAADYPAVSAFADHEATDDALSKLLGCEVDLLARLDPRTLLGLRRPGAPAHVLSRFIIVKLLSRAGPLIDEALLAVRLGVDPEQSEDWPELLKKLATSSYSGAYASGYPRWWMIAVRDWWEREIDQERTPARLGASDRVSLLVEKTGFAKLHPIKPNADSPGSRYWHRCFKSGLPVDPTEGFPMMPVYGTETWHDTEYLCLEEALRDARNPRLGPSERGRIDAIIRRRSGS